MNEFRPAEVLGPGEGVFKQVCDRVLADAPEPPRRGVDEVLARARRADRRASRLVAVASGLAVATIAVVAVLAATPPAAVPPRLSGPAATPAATATPTELPTVRPPELPSLPAADGHGGRIYQALVAAVPSGLSAAPDTRMGGVNPDTVSFEFPQPGQYESQTDVVVSDGSRAGSLWAIILGDATAAPTGDLCTAAIQTRLARWANSDGPCGVITIRGVAVRVNTTPDGSSIVATRFLEGGYLSVRASRRAVSSGPDDRNSPCCPDSTVDRPPLPAPALTVDQLAALAADPALLP
jgi:hypothetical protein